MDNVSKITSAMQSPVTIVVESFRGLQAVDGEEVTLDKVLEQWLPVAGDIQARVYLNIGRWCMTIVKYVAAMAALGNLQDGRLRMPTIADIAADGERRLLKFFYAGRDGQKTGGKVVLVGCDFFDTTFSLKALCEKHLLHSLTLANACRYFSVACNRAGAEQCASDRLKKAAGRLILRNVSSTTMTTVGWTALIYENPGLLRELLLMAVEHYY